MEHHHAHSIIKTNASTSMKWRAGTKSRCDNKRLSKASQERTGGQKRQPQHVPVFLAVCLRLVVLHTFCLFGHHDAIERNEKRNCGNKRAKETRRVDERRWAASIRQRTDDVRKSSWKQEGARHKSMEILASVSSMKQKTQGSRAHSHYHRRQNVRNISTHHVRAHTQPHSLTVRQRSAKPPLKQRQWQQQQQQQQQQLTALSQPLAF